MVNGFLWFAVMLNISACCLSVWAYHDFKKKAREADDYVEEYCKLAIGGRHALFKLLGAYDAENGEMYLDLNDNLRLVIFEGKIEGWYFTK